MFHFNLITKPAPQVFVFIFLLFVLPVFGAKGIKIGMTLEPPHLDPTVGSAGATDEIVYANIFEGLTRINEQSQVLPALAKSWKISQNSKKYVFTLRKNIKFHNGENFTAKSVKFSFDRASSKKSTNAQKTRFKNIETTKILGDFTVEITLKKTDVEFLYFLGFGDAIILSEKTVAQNRYLPVGTGPFHFDFWKKGSHIRLKKNKNYWGTLARIDSAEFYFISDPNAAKNSLLSGDLDGFSNFPAPEILPIFERDSRFQVSVGNTEGETILAMNNKNPALKNLKVRRAISRAINRVTLIEGAMSGYATPIGTHFSPNNPDYLDLTDRYPYDPKLAKASLKKAGYDQNLKLVLKLPPPPYARRSGEIIASELKKIGILVQIIPVEWSRWLEEVFRNRNYDLTIISHTEPLDLDIYARSDYYFNYQNSAYNKIIKDLQTTKEKKSRTLLYHKAQRILTDDAVNVFLFQLAKIGVWKKDIHNLWKNAPIQANDLTAVYRK